jgi:hypothetical protein
MKTATTTTATVKFPAGKRFASNFQGGKDRINVVLTDASGEAIRLYGDCDDAALLALQKGDSVQLAHDGRAWLLLSAAPASPPPAAPAPQRPQAAHIPQPQQKSKEDARQDRRRYTAALVREYAEILDQVCAAMEPHNLADTLLKDIATSIFIQDARHFNL